MVAMPFGMHKGKPVAEVPVPYLRWVIRTVERLSPDLETAILVELRARGCHDQRPAALSASAAPRKWKVICHRCRMDAGVSYLWSEDRAGRRRIRKQCRRCGAWLGQAAQTGAALEEANRADCATGMLDVL